MLRKLLLTGSIAVVVWGVVNALFALASGRFDIPEWLGHSLYIAAFYLAPAAFIVAIIGSIVFVIKSRLGK